MRPERSKLPASLDRLRTPAVDLMELTIQLGQAWAVTAAEPLAQYLAWSEQAGIFSLLTNRASTSIKDIDKNTVLNEQGADALMCILTSLKLVCRNESNYALTQLGKEYLV